jgi:hypothetical protein
MKFNHDVFVVVYVSAKREYIDVETFPSFYAVIHMAGVPNAHKLKDWESNSFEGECVISDFLGYVMGIVRKF